MHRSGVSSSIALARLRIMVGVGLVLALIIASSPDIAAAPSGGQCPAKNRVGKWTSVEVEFPPEDDSLNHPGMALVDVAMDPTNSRTLFAHNGTTLLRSLDGGCRWEKVFRLPAVIDGVVNSHTYLDKVVPADDGSKHRIYLTGFNYQRLVYWRNSCLSVLCFPATHGRAHVWVSMDGGTTWKEADKGLPEVLTASQPLSFEVAPSDADVAYLAGSGDGTQSVSLFTTKDAGQSWTEVLYGKREATLVNGDLAVDPRNADHLWGFLGPPPPPWNGSVYNGNDRRHLSLSTDGGTTWKELSMPDWASGGTNLEAIRLPSHGVQLSFTYYFSGPTVCVYKAGTIAFSSDEGGTWSTAQPLPGCHNVSQIVAGTKRGQFFARHSSRLNSDACEGVARLDSRSGVWTDMSFLGEDTYIRFLPPSLTGGVLTGMTSSNQWSCDSSGWAKNRILTYRP